MLRITLRESREQQIRRELDDVVNGNDYGYTPKDSGEDPTVARAKGLEIDEPKKHFNFGEDWKEYGHDISKELYHGPDGEYNKITYYPNGRPKQIITDPGSSTERVIEFYKNGKVKSIAFSEKNEYETVTGPTYIEYDEIGNTVARKFTFEGKGYFSFQEWADAYYERYDGYADPINLYDVRNVERERRRAASKQYEFVSSKSRLGTSDLEDVADTEYKFTKNRKPPADPRFANLDLTDNQPPQKTDDVELGNRAKGLEVDKPKEPEAYKFSKNRKPPSDPRFKGLELNERLSIIKEAFKRLL